MMPVSVVIPAYNAAATLERAVLSALRAAPAGSEILLVDDGSTDATTAVAAQLAARHEGSVRVLAHPGGTNRGASASRNLGVRAARHDVLAFLDCDDWYLPNRFAASLLLLADPAVDGVHETVQVQLEGRTSELPDDYWDTARPLGLPPADGRTVTELLCLGYCWQMNAITLRRSAFEACGGFADNIVIGEDIEWGIRLSCVAKLVAGDPAQPVAVYVRHDANRSQPCQHGEMVSILGAALDWARRQGRSEDADRIRRAGREYVFMAAGRLREQRQSVQARRLLWQLARTERGALLTRRFWGNLRRSLGTAA